MSRLEDLQPHAAVRGLLPDSLATVVSVQWFGSEALELTYKDAAGRPANVLLYRYDEPRLEVVEQGRPWSFDGDGSLFRLVSEAHRIRLGQLLSTLTRHFLLLTATPHNGKEADFQLFMALLDGDRFEGRFRDGVHTVDVSDLMRRMVKEHLLTFDATPLFPERLAYTVPYTLSDAEAQLYKEVTTYVRDEFNRAEALQNDKRAGTVGFALTILQRRLASSPEAIYQSLRRRRERLATRLRELQLLQRGAVAGALAAAVPALDAEDVDDLEDAPDDEVDAAETEILDQATAARTITELAAEIATLQHLESLAATVRRSGEDRKWRELANLLVEIFTPVAIADQGSETSALDGGGPVPKSVASPRQKLVIFTEHRDTLNYLAGQITTLLGREHSVVTIHGGMGREERRKAQERFLHDPEVKVLVATDAAGEGINLQRAHLMVNYDLPWNPNRLEQRFGRIHRIGQTEVCHLWNLLAEETREGDVYRVLLDKLDEARKALGGQVFDVLGQVQFDGRPLRDPGEQPRVLFALEHAIQDASLTRTGERRVVSKRLLYVELDPAGEARHLHYAPYLDYRPLAPDEPTASAVLDRPECAWITRALEQQAQGHAIARVVPEHLHEVRAQRAEWIDKTRAAVRERLTKEISYWDHRAEVLKLQEQAGRPNARLNSQEARRRADDLQARLQRLLEQLDQEAQLAALPPVVLGGVVVMPIGLLARLTGRPLVTPTTTTDTQAAAARARAIVMAVERHLGFEPTDREVERLGYDIESLDPHTGRLRFLEVKGRVSGADTITVTKNEILTSLNKPEEFILALVEFLDEDQHRVRYLRRPFRREPDFGVTSVNYDFAELLARAEEPL